MELFSGINSGDVEEMSFLLKQKLSFLQKDNRGFTPLLLACTLGKVYTEVYKAKKKLYGENLSEGEPMSALHLACCADDRNFVRKLLESGADINERVPETCPVWPDYTPLQLCIEYKFEIVARMLLNWGADLNIVSPNGLTPIFMAENKRLRTLTPTMLRRYTSWTVNPVHKESGESYLHLACKYDLVDVVEALLHHGADVNMQNDLTPEHIGKLSRRNCTPLHMAKDSSVIKVLLRYGADLGMRDSFNDTPLHKAFHEANNEALETMLEGHGQCRANPADKSGISHLHIACRRGSVAAIKGILEHSVDDINMVVSLHRSKWTGYSSMHFAVEHGSVEVVQLLLDHGASLECTNGNGWTPLVMAVFLRDDTSIAQILIDAGANINSKGLRPFIGTALHVAARREHTNHVALLLERGAEPNPVGYWWSPLHLACQKLNVEIVRLLLEQGAEPNAKQEHGDATPLHMCVKANNDANSNDDRHGRIISLLVEAGADLNACDSRSFCPIHEAAINKDERPLRALLFYCTDMQLSEITSKTLSIRIERPFLSIQPFLEQLEMLDNTKFRDVTSHDNELLKSILEGSLLTEDEISSIRNACRKEIEDLQKLGLEFFLTYSKIFAKDAIEVGRLWQRSDKLVELVESNELHKFPVYGDRLRRWYDDLQRVPACLDQALEFVNKHWNLDQDSAEMIFRYLNSKELEAFVKAFEF